MSRKIISFIVLLLTPFSVLAASSSDNFQLESSGNTASSTNFELVATIPAMQTFGASDDFQIIASDSESSSNDSGDSNDSDPSTPSPISIPNSNTNTSTGGGGYREIILTPNVQTSSEKEVVAQEENEKDNPEAISSDSTNKEGDSEINDGLQDTQDPLLVAYEEYSDVKTPSLKKYSQIADENKHPSAPKEVIENTDFESDIGAENPLPLFKPDSSIINVLLIMILFFLTRILLKK